MFTRGNFDHGRASATNGQPEYSETLNVTTFALMERRDGTTYIDAVVQRELQDTVNNEVIQKENAHALSGSHLHFASEYRECGIPDEEPYRNWLLLPREKASGQMFPIPPGAVRGVWRKPAITADDFGKLLTVVGAGTIMVGGEARSVGWTKGAAPTNVNDEVIRSVDDFNDHLPRIGFDSGRFIEVPYLTGAANEKTIDLAFALTEKHDGGTVSTRFFMPVARELLGASETYLVDAREVRHGELQFHSFIGACRN